MESKYSTFLTILLVVIIIAIIGCLAFGAYKVYEQINSTKDANEFVGSFVGGETNNNNTNTPTNDVNEPEDNDILNQLQNTPTGNGTGTNVPSYKGFAVVGTIEIPKINLSYPILRDNSTSALERSVAMAFGVGPNKVGNTLIVGHNYRNGQFFANNKNLNKGDKVYITDLSGQRLPYTIYDRFETVVEDSGFLTRNTNGAREISLQTCTDDGNYRLILLAKCDLDS